MPGSVVNTLLIANIVCFLLEAVTGNSMLSTFALWPLGVLGESGLAPPFYPWQLFTYGFLHGGLLHLALNMYALWMFGSQLERVWGPRRFAFYYFACLIGAALTQLMVSEYTLVQGGMAYPVLGASGAVFGLLLAYGLLFPYNRLMLLFPPIPIEARWFVLGYGLIELYAGVTGSMEGVAHFAHLGGMLTGWILIKGKRLA